jgi:hypothetical protein
MALAGFRAGRDRIPSTETVRSFQEALLFCRPSSAVSSGDFPKAPSTLDAMERSILVSTTPHYPGHQRFGFGVFQIVISQGLISIEAHFRQGRIPNRGMVPAYPRVARPPLTAPKLCGPRLTSLSNSRLRSSGGGSPSKQCNSFMMEYLRSIPCAVRSMSPS